MRRYLFRRLLTSIPTLVLVTWVTFGLVFFLPGDPALAYLGEENVHVPPEVLEKVRHEFGLDRPIPVQYALWLGRVFKGDFGKSIYTYKSVRVMLVERLPATAQIAVASWLVALLIGIPVGILAAIRRNSRIDMAANVFVMVGVGTPTFWLGILFILLFAQILGWLPTSGYANIFDNPVKGFRLLILPSVALGIHSAAFVLRQTRSSLLEVLHQDYIRTAEAKGLPRMTVIGLHALKNAMLPVVTILGLQLGRLFGGIVITETVFAIPGVGRMVVDAVFARDFLVVQAVILLTAACVLLANFLTDLIYGYLDPRIRYG